MQVEKFIEFANSKQVQVVLEALVESLEIPESFKRDSEFNTVWALAEFEGGKALVERFKNLINNAMEGNLEKLQNKK